MISRRLLLFLLPFGLAVAGDVSLRQGDGKIDVAIDGKPFTTFYYGPSEPKPYLHPLRAADGTIVTRLYPMQDVPGERQDHPHHRGLWFTHGNVNGFDFWANEPSQEIEHKGVVAVKGKPTAQGDTIGSAFEWKTPDGKLLLTEDRAMRFAGDAKTRTIDLDIKLTAGPQTVKFGDTKEGTFAIRLATPLEEPHARAEGVPRTGKIVAATGKTGEGEVWGTQSPWVDYSGAIDGKKLGVAIFDHPSNPKHPTYWHVRSYGLFAANIFGEHDFYRDKNRDGGVTLKPGESMRFRYRVVIHSGDTEDAQIGQGYAKWSGKTAGKTE
jgi:hypothetical protein